MRLATAKCEPANRRTGEPANRRIGDGRRLAVSPIRSRRSSAFTLAEVLAALMFMAIVIPVVVEALHIASVSGEVAVRKAEASRVADRVLNENIVTTNWNQYATGTITENGREFRWTLRNEYWPSESAMQLLTAEVEFTAQGRTYAVRMNTLANSQSSSGLTGMP